MIRRVLAAVLIPALALAAPPLPKDNRQPAPKAAKSPTCDEQLARAAIVFAIVGFLIGRHAADDGQPASPYRP